MDGVASRKASGGWIRRLAKHRRGLAVGGLLLVAAGLWAWWALQLWGLPDVGDPFDVAGFQPVRIADERNAFVEYGQASGLHRAIWSKMIANNTFRDVTELPASWAEANPTWRDYLAQARATEALRIWRAGADKPEAVYEHPEGLRFRTILNVTQELRGLCWLGLVEGMRLESEGDTAGAWGWYRSALRSSRHSGHHGFQVERMTGAAIHRGASQVITRWASNPRVDAARLRQALDEVIAIDAMTVPRSETLKVEYLLFVHELNNPDLIEDTLLLRNDPDEPADWCVDLPISLAGKKPIQTVRVALANDRERSLRLARLLIANWLHETDRPPSQRSKLFQTLPMIYEADPAGPPASRALPPAELAKWLDTSLLASREFRWLNKSARGFDLERARQARLVVHLASELYRREHGRPPGSPEALVGSYLKALPEGHDSVEEPPKPLK